MQKVELYMQKLPTAGCHFFVNAQIERVPLRLLIDSGASVSMLDKQWLSKHFPSANCRAIDMQTTGIHPNISPSPTVFVTLENLSIDQYNYGMTGYSLLSLAHINDAYRAIGLQEINGLLGSDWLGKHGAVISYAEQRMFLTQTSFLQT